MKVSVGGKTYEVSQPLTQRASSITWGPSDERVKGTVTSDPSAQMREAARRLATAKCTFKAGLPPEKPAELKQWVRDAFLQANVDLAIACPSGRNSVQEKIDKMRISKFFFERGADTLIGLDMAKHTPPLSDEPFASLDVDAHPTNYGAYDSIGERLVYDRNDYDEVASLGPFSYDVRHETLLWLAASESANHTKKQQEAVANAYVQGFTDKIREFARRGGENTFILDVNTAEGPIKELLQQQNKLDPGAWVKSITEKVDDKHHRFVESRDLKRTPKYLPVIKAKLKELGVNGVMDVAIKYDSGTASLGLPRFYALIDGGTGRRKDNTVIEIKQEIRSAWEGVPYVSFDPTDSRASQVADATLHAPAEPYRHVGSFKVAAELLDAVPVAGLKEVSFLVRERPGRKKAIDLEGMSAQDMITVARQDGYLEAANLARQQFAGGRTPMSQSVVAFLDRHPDFTQRLVAAALSASARMELYYQYWKEAFPKYP